MMQSHIVRQNMGFAVEINGRRLPLYAYMSYQPAHADYAEFQAAGVQLYCTGVYAGDRGINPGSGIRPFRPGFFRGPDHFDFSAADEDFSRIVGDAAPGECYLLPRLMLELPGWWEALHPEALCRDVQGTPLHVSYAAPEWLETCTLLMEKFQQWLHASGWDRYVIGWHLAGGGTEEFIRPLLHPMHYLDDSAPARAHFSQWLVARYENIQALNDAWRTQWNTFEEVQPPTPAQRQYALQGELRDKQREAQAMDYYRFHSESLAEAVVSLCKAAKAVTGGQQIMGAFYGYTVNVPNPEQGHHAAKIVLESDAVDFLASPFTYMDHRAQGVDWPFQGAVESAHLHGKPWFMEADVRTHLSRPISQCMAFANPVGNTCYDAQVWWGPKDLEGSLGQMGKAFARILTHGTATWWFDMWGGWYRQPELMTFQRKACEIYRRAMMEEMMYPTAQVAVFLDEEMYASLAPGADTANEAIYQLLKQLGWMGAPYHLYLLSDFPSVPAASYRMAIFPMALHWTDASREALPAWRNAGRTLLFTGQPDLWGNGAQALTGIACKMDMICALKAKLPGMQILPQRGDVVRAVREDGTPDLVLHRDASHQTAWSLSLVLAPEVLRELALLAGAHIYSFDGDVVYANSDFVALHACKDGDKRLYLPRKGALEDAFTGEWLEGCDTFTDFPMTFGQTRLFRIHWAEEAPRGVQSK